ncbi:Druantia anti-phage system protein DruA [Streptomyces bobili]|uniref:Druantia anti-phage system protein DruA n=1 Tax=Streptomyces bobili TaxID=67280 RepID=UPI0034260CA5
MKAAKINNLYDQPLLAAAAHVAIDLVDQGWTVQVDGSKAVCTPPSVHGDRKVEKARIRRQEHLRRDEQLRKSSVRRFVEGMERTHQHGDRLVSVFNLMRDGRELADALQRAGASTDVVKPYVQIVDSSTCELTGFKLHDIWRYFRHTWSNAYATVPGRSMAILVRDAATEFHAVIGLAAISSPVVQIAERDHWMGWETDQFLEHVQAEPTADVACWLAQRIEGQQSEIYVDDLLRDGILQPTDLAAPTPEVIARLRADGDRHRQRHHQATTIRAVRNIDREAWVERATTDLFRSKRSAALAEALEIVMLLGGYLSPPTIDGLTKAFSDPKARSQMRRVVRRARGERVGTVIADLTVCGAVAPYNALAAGKLVGALAVSAKVLTAYREKYARPSEIASAMAGRPILREPRLSFIGTTSLYGTGSSQYNRLFWPADVMGGDGDIRMGFHELGRSRSFGTSHFSDETVDALVRVSALRGSAVRVNSLFGEGVSPRLRKVRVGLAALGWPANELLKHGRERILYGVPLVENLRDYSLGIDREPKYLLNAELTEADAKVSEWWLERWCRRRAAQDHVLESMRSHRLVRPVEHGARVPLPVGEGMPAAGEEMFPISS